MLIIQNIHRKSLVFFNNTKINIIEIARFFQLLMIYRLIYCMKKFSALLSVISSDIYAMISNNFLHIS
jgi:hypothetical protein